MSAAGWEWDDHSGDCRFIWSVRSPAGTIYAVHREPPSIQVCGAQYCWVVRACDGDQLVWHADGTVVWVGRDLWNATYWPPRRQVERAIERWERERARGGGK